MDSGAGDVEYVFTLTVTDTKGTTAATDTVTITVTAPSFDALVAEAGPDQDNVASGAPVTLDGSGSTVTDSSRTVTYAWDRTGGPVGGSVRLTGANTLQPAFTADMLDPGVDDVEHVFTLTVTDNKGITAATDTVTIPVNAPPFDALVAEAGSDQDNVASGAPVTLEGSGSTVTDSSRTVTYAWDRTGGPVGGAVTLTGANTLQPSFTADTLTAGVADVEHIITLTVTDDKGTTAAKAATDTVTSGFLDPVAMIADGVRELDSGATVQLDGSGSTHDDRTTLTYSWARTGGTSTATGTLTDATTAMPSFTAETLTDGAPDVTHILTLTVTDGESVTDTAMVTITVTSGFAAPDAIIAGGNRELASGATVPPDGSGSTHDSRTTVTYAWERTGGNGGSVTLISASAERPTFTAEILTDGADDVTHILTLTVIDGESVTDTATVTITVTSGFTNPVAEAGDPQSVGSGATVTFDGSGSTHDSRTTVTYAWTRTGGNGGSVTLSSASAERPTFTADTLADGDPDVIHTFTLTVTDSEGGTDTDMMTVTASAVLVDILVSPSELMVQEGGSGTYQVKLSKSPRREVNVIANSDDENIVLENAQLHSMRITGMHGRKSG